MDNEELGEAEYEVEEVCICELEQREILGEEYSYK